MNYNLPIKKHANFFHFHQFFKLKFHYKKELETLMTEDIAQVCPQYLFQNNLPWRLKFISRKLLIWFLCTFFCYILYFSCIAYKCKSDHDCNHKGFCDNEKCVCNSGWYSKMWTRKPTSRENYKIPGDCSGKTKFIIHDTGQVPSFLYLLGNLNLFLKKI